MKTLILSLLVCFSVGAQAQNDDFVAALGKSSTSDEFKKFAGDYKLEESNASRYQSKDGIEVIVKDGIVREVHVHKSSPVFGSYTGKLPSSLNFGMSSEQVRNLLGVPTTAYTSSGYTEYEYATYNLSCWFEEGTLRQVVVSSK
jgi:hypothetical protein